METRMISGRTVMIVPYEWILDNVDKDLKTIASKMILFQGLKVFRVGLNRKTNVKGSTFSLFFMAVDLNRIGMRVDDVTFEMESGDDTGDPVPPTMTQMKKENIGPGDESSSQLFTFQLDQTIDGKCTFTFRIRLESCVDDYSYQLCDRLAKDQLWESVDHLAGDVKFILEDGTFMAHKAILAARSPVFESKFVSKEIPGQTNGRVPDVQLIRVDGVESLVFEEFLHFIYTGESCETLDNEELLKLADEYQLTTLSNLCRVAMNQIDALQMVGVVKILNHETAGTRSQISPVKETEIFFDEKKSTFRCGVTCSVSESVLQPNALMNYQNESLFFAYLQGKIKNNGCLYSPSVHFSSANHRNFGLRIDDVYFNEHQGAKWIKMESNSHDKAAVNHFVSQSKLKYSGRKSNQVYFDVGIVSTLDHYGYEMVDDNWIKDFWFAAINKKLTDVDVFVGSVKVMEAHRVILSARSPVLRTSWKSVGTRKSAVVVNGKFNFDIVEYFVKFLYTGVLETSASHKDLLQLATIYEVETLKNLCQSANNVPDLEELTNSLLGL